MASVQANGITIEYSERGAGEPLLLVMGLGGQLVDWPEGFVDALVDHGFRVIAFDNRDSGLSTEIDARPPSKWQIAQRVGFRRPLRTAYTLADMARDAAALLAALDIESAHVVGISMGGMIAQTMAIEHPARVRSLTSVMSTTGNHRVGQPSFSFVRSWMRRDVPSRANAVEAGVTLFREVCGPTFDEDEFRRMAERSVARSYRPLGTLRQTAAIIGASDRTPRLRAVTAPTLVVHGLLDRLVRPSGGIATAKAVPGARLVMYNDMAHDLPPTRWSELADEIAANAARARVDEPTAVALSA